MSHHRRRSGPVPTLTFINHGVSDADATTYDFGDFNAPSGGLIVVGVSGVGAAARTISSVSIGGTNGTIQVQDGDTEFTPLGFVTRPVSAGNNNVTVVFSAGMVRAAVSVWLLTNYASATPHASDAGDAGGAVTSQDVVMNIPIRGVAAFINYHGSNEVTNWLTATERVDVTMDGNRFAAADKTVVAAITPHTETISWATGSGSFALGASWS